MRRILIGVLLVVGLLVLAGCGNKGPLVRPPATTAPAATVAPAAVAAPAHGAPPAAASSSGTTP